MAPKMIHEFTMGADPEIILVNASGKMVEAISVITNRWEAAHGLFGVDGSGHGPAELRPMPTNKPEALVDNLQYCMQHGLKLFPRLALHEWRAGTAPMGSHIGGHIHIGLKHILKYKKIGYDSLTHWLDFIVATPMLLTEDKEESIARRLNGKYGHPGDYRADDVPWGIEYRTLGSWLTCPEVTYGVLALAYAAIWEYINVGVKLDSMPEIDSKRWRSYEDDYIKGLADRAIDRIKTLAMYDKYSSPIDYVLNDIIRAGKLWYPDGSRDIKSYWGLTMPDSDEMDREEIDSAVEEALGRQPYVIDAPARIRMPLDLYMDGEDNV